MSPFASDSVPVVLSSSPYVASPPHGNGNGGPPMIFCGGYYYPSPPASPTAFMSASTSMSMSTSTSSTSTLQPKQSRLSCPQSPPSLLTFTNTTATAATSTTTCLTSPSSPSPSPPPSCSSPSECKPKNKKSVQFAPNSLVYAHLHIDEYHPSEIQASWWNASECARIAQNVRRAIARLEHERRGGGPHQPQASFVVGGPRATPPPTCERGIDCHTRIQEAKRARIREGTYDSVLLEQEAQWDEHIWVPELLAHAYRKWSVPSQAAAHYRALKDSKEARTICALERSSSNGNLGLTELVYDSQVEDEEGLDEVKQEDDEEPTCTAQLELSTAKPPRRSRKHRFDASSITTTDITCRAAATMTQHKQQAVRSLHIGDGIFTSHRR